MKKSSFPVVFFLWLTLSVSQAADFNLVLSMDRELPALTSAKARGLWPDLRMKKMNEINRYYDSYKKGYFDTFTFNVKSDKVNNFSLERYYDCNDATEPENYIISGAGKLLKFLYRHYGAPSRYILQTSFSKQMPVFEWERNPFLLSALFYWGKSGGSVMVCWKSESLADGLSENFKTLTPDAFLALFPYFIPLPWQENGGSQAILSNPPSPVSPAE